VNSNPDEFESSLQQRLERARELISREHLPSNAGLRVQPDRAELHPKIGWDDHPDSRMFKRKQAEVARLGIAPLYFTARESMSMDTISVSGREMLNFSGYNYLGLSGHPEVSAAAKTAIDRYGTSASASRIASGEILLHGDLEREIAGMLGVESCLVFSSGYETNVSTISYLFGPNDLLVHDVASHSSVTNGCKFSGARRLAFPHNDINTLDRLLAAHRSRHERALIVIEGVYSMDGDIAPLPELIELKHRHRAMLMVDEAHSVGVLGRRGFGIGEHFRIEPTEVDIWMGTLSKTLAGIGGYIAGSGALIELLRYNAPGFVFTCGIAPPMAAASLAALRILKREPERVDILRERSAAFLSSARTHRLNTGTSNGTSVIPIIVGDWIRAMQLAQLLADAGIMTYPIFYPAVPEETARVRFFVSMLHTPEQIQHTVEIVAEAVRQVSGKEDVHRAHPSHAA
jgi:8-amino-7-oxononanoate synthase